MNVGIRTVYDSLGVSLGTFDINPRADLRGIDFRRADLIGEDLRWANLSGANLSRANLSGAFLVKTTLSRANLTGADLKGAYLQGANLAGASYSALTKFPDGFDPKAAGMIFVEDEGKK